VFLVGNGGLIDLPAMIIPLKAKRDKSLKPIINVIPYGGVAFSGIDRWPGSA
jgi:hypothetical protein